jgi:hypothetical protein
MSICQIVVWIIVGGFAGTLKGWVVILKKEGLGGFIHGARFELLKACSVCSANVLAYRSASVNSN